MNLRRSPQKDADRVDLLDATMASYANWRDQSRAVAESYRTWSSAVGLERDAAFDRYVAALDREEHAARGYRRLVDRADALSDPRLVVR